MKPLKRKQAALTQVRLTEALSYNADTGVFVWRRAHNGRVSVGQVAGNVDKTRFGYRRIKLFKRFYPAHHLAWFYVHGVWPPAELDHVNGKKDDNRIDNLRLATRAENCRNRIPMVGKKVPLKGIHQQQNGKVSGLLVKGAQRLHLGTYDTVHEAAMAYDIAAIKHFGEFAWLNFPNGWSS